MKIVKMSGGEALISDRDYTLVSRYAWYIDRGYAKAHTGKTTMYMHRLIKGDKKRWQIDHVNHNGLDNRRSNLRFASYAQNHMNQLPRAGCASEFKGVSVGRHGTKWLAQIKHRGKQYYLGEYLTQEEAARAYNTAAARLFGRFACLNPV